jgi:signal transduction histidine kinase
VRARIAWGFVALTTLAFILDTAFTAAHRALLSETTWADHGWPLVPLACAGCAVMGALIVSRYPRHPLGWLLCVASLLSVTLAAEAYSSWVLEGDGPGSPYWAHVSAWAGPLFGWPAFTALVMVFLISPDGHLLSPRWRWAARVTLAGLVLRTLGALTIPPGDFVEGSDYANGTLSTVLLTIGWILVAAGLIASVVSLAMRLRRARDDVRRQLLWIASAAVFLAFGVAFILVVPLIQNGQELTWLAALPLRLAHLAVPLCVAVAVLRHRLLEIDLIVNRALLLALATGLVAVGYVLVVVVVGLAVGGNAGGFWPSLLATAVVAMAFQPLRRRVVRVADRLAFGAAAAPYEALADFSRRLGDSPDPSALLPAVAGAAARAVNASRAMVLLAVEGGPDRLATWPPSGAKGPATSGVAIPVMHGGEQLGSITVHMPVGRALRKRDRALLDALAAQAGMAFRNARLSAELSGEVEQLDHRTHALAESRRRLITADDAERSRLERSIARQVVLHLALLPDQLQQLSQVDGDNPVAPDAAVLGSLIASTTRALEELREITRGVFPAQLSRSGLQPALASLLGRGNAGRLIADPSMEGHRLDPRVEAAAYFCVGEVLADLLPPVEVVVASADDRLSIVVSGGTGANLPVYSLRDRVETVDGSVTIRSTPAGTVVELSLPDRALEGTPA